MQEQHLLFPNTPPKLEQQLLFLNTHPSQARTALSVFRHNPKREQQLVFPVTPQNESNN